MESSHFWPSVLHDPLYKILFFDFWFRPPNAQNLLPKICTISPISRLVWQIDRRCLGLPGGFRGWPIQWNHAKCCGADPCCHDNEMWARRGDPVAYRLVVCICLLGSLARPSQTHHSKFTSLSSSKSGNAIVVRSSVFNLRQQQQQQQPCRPDITCGACLL